MKDNWNCLFIDCNNFQIEQFEKHYKNLFKFLCYMQINAENINDFYG